MHLQIEKQQFTRCQFQNLGTWFRARPYTNITRKSSTPTSLIKLFKEKINIQLVLFSPKTKTIE